MFCCSSLVVTALPLLLWAVGALSPASISPCWGGGTVVIAMCGLGSSALMRNPGWPASPGSFFSASGSLCFLFQASVVKCALLQMQQFKTRNSRPACLLVSPPTPLLFSFFLSLVFLSVPLFPSIFCQPGLLLLPAPA